MTPSQRVDAAKKNLLNSNLDEAISKAIEVALDLAYEAWKVAGEASNVAKTAQTRADKALKEAKKPRN